MSTTIDHPSGACAYTSFPETLSRAAQPSELAFCRSRLADEWSSVIDELLRMRELENDWDGEGSPAPQKAIVDAVTAFALQGKQRNTEPPHRVVASVNGTICLEWFDGRSFREIEFVTPEAYECRVFRTKGN